MARLLYNTATATTQPYPRQDDEPVVGLDPIYRVLAVVTLPQPDYDPATHTVTPTETTAWDAPSPGVDGTLTRGWSIVALPAPPPPAPDWISFYDGLIASAVYSSFLAQATQSTELCAYMVALSAALIDAKAGPANVPAIQAAVDLVVGAAQLTSDERTEISALLAASNLAGVVTMPPVT